MTEGSEYREDGGAVNFYPNGSVEFPDGSGFFIAEIDQNAKPWEPIADGYDAAVQWNPFNKVVQDHRDGTIIDILTNEYRAARGLPTPWKPWMADVECRQAPTF